MHVDVTLSESRFSTYNLYHTNLVQVKDGREGERETAREIEVEIGTRRGGDTLRETSGFPSMIVSS